MKRIKNYTLCICALMLTVSASYSLVAMTNAAIEVLLTPEYSEYE